MAMEHDSCADLVETDVQPIIFVLIVVGGDTLGNVGFMATTRSTSCGQCVERKDRGKDRPSSVSKLLVRYIRRFALESVYVPAFGFSSEESVLFSDPLLPR